MKNFSRFSNNWGRVLDTLVESETAVKHLPKAKQSKPIAGEGSDLTNTEMQKRWAKRKTTTQKMMLSLIDVAKYKGDKHRVKAYWNTYHCQSIRYSFGDKIHGNFCKNRFCTVCLAIRKADIMNRYLPVIQKWEAPFFLTITAKAVTADQLHSRIREFETILRLIINKHRKRNQRGKGIKFMGIKSLECNFNPTDKTYNPHFHMILPNLQVADTIMTEWRKYWWKRHGEKSVSKTAQYNRRVKDKTRDLKEIVKYGSKIFTETDPNKKSTKKAPRHIYIAALDNIYSAFEGHRVFDRFGFNLPPKTINKTKPIYTTEQCIEWKYNPLKCDWIDKNESKLTGYLPSAELMALLDNLNITLE